MIFGLLRKINTAQPVRQGGLWDVYGMGKMFVYGKERLVCDCLKFEEKLDREILQKMLYHYIRESQKDIQKLTEYAKIRRVTQKVQNRIGVWL